MRQITDKDELRTLQKSILDEIHKYCISHGITYYLASGSLLGAVRHQGYIPWDDDIDLYMPRADYERFVREYHDDSGRYELLEPRRTKHYVYTFAKLSDTRTIMHEDAYEGYPIGVNVDIFPLDYVSDNMMVRRLVFTLKRQVFRICIDKIVPLLRDHRPSNILKRLVCKMLPVSRLMLIRLMRRLEWHKGKSSTVVNMTGMGPGIEACFSAHALDGTVDLPFEGKMYKTMAGYKEYLTYTYGDYMKLPPVDQRQTHKFEAYWKD